MPGDFLQLHVPPDAPLRRAALRAVRPLLEWAIAARTLDRLYELARVDDRDGFVNAVLRALSLSVRCDERDRARIPAHGPLLVAANHPHGALDGLMLAHVLGTRRRDVRLLANHLLARIPEMRDLCFFVDPFAGPGAADRSRGGLRAAHLWLRQGGTLVAFPAGEVAPRRCGDATPEDSRWKTTVGRLAAATGALVMPAWIDGHNSSLFYAAGRIHPSLRTLLLARELLAKRGCTVALRLGSAVPSRQLVASGGDPAALTRHIRTSVEALRTKGTADVAVDSHELMAAETRRLPSEACLVEAGDFQIFVASAGEIPSTLTEIGRLREITYRGVGEGTGRDSDLDRFDDQYLHLFSWNRVRREVVGAYRIGRTDDILARVGVDGLYTRTLFRYERQLLDRLPPALELGRSFVRPEYQRNHTALLLLWKGICAFISRHPRYRCLFGAVSISARYSDPSRDLLMMFLEQNHRDEALAELVEPSNPDTPSPPDRPAGGVPVAADEINRLIARLEPDGKGIPVLLRQYLKLNARLLGFNLDPRFGDALDALMIVDLLTVEPPLLKRYFGAAEADAFLALHRSLASTRAA